MTRDEILLIAEDCGYVGDEAKAYAAGYEAALQSRQAAVSGMLPLPELKEAFQAGKYLGFGEAYRRPGDYNSFEDWLKIRSGNDR